MAGTNSPHEWLGLLKWSLQYQDGTHPSPKELKPLAKEDIEFLDKVMKSLVRDEIKAMTDAFESLINYNRRRGGDAMQVEGEKEDLDADIMARLEDLQDIVEQIDMAGTFVKIGGPGCLLELAMAEDKPAGPRAQAAAVIGTLCQNNERVQEAFVKAGALPILRRLVAGKEVDSSNNTSTAATTTTTNSSSSSQGEGVESSGGSTEASAAAGVVSVPMEVRVKCMTALSAVTRGNTHAECEMCGGGTGDGASGNAAAGGGGGGQASPDSSGMFDAIFCPTGWAGEGADDAKLTPLQQKAVFFMKAMVLSDGPTEQHAARVEFFMPYLKRIVELLAGTCSGGSNSNSDSGNGLGSAASVTAAAEVVVVELCVQFLCACVRVDGKNVTAEVGGSMKALMAERRETCRRVIAACAERGEKEQAQGESAGGGDGDGGGCDDDEAELEKENATFELGLWDEWEALST